jgi:ankyrin repeat protein
VPGVSDAMHHLAELDKDKPWYDERSDGKVGEPEDAVVRLSREETSVPQQVQEVRDTLGIGEAELDKREKGVDATYVIARDGLKTVSLGHGKTKSAVPIEKGDKLGMAAQRNDITKVKKLLKKGVSPNVRNQVSGVNPLGVAAERGHLEVVKLLLAAKARVMDATNDGLNSLHIAAQFGQHEVTKLLTSEEQMEFERDTYDLNLPGGYNGNTALMSAIARNSILTMRVLVEAGADINYLSDTSHSGSALHIACRLGNVTALTELVVRPGVDVLLRNRLDETPMEVAVTSGTHAKFIECANLLRPLCKALGAPKALVDKSDEYIRMVMHEIADRLNEEIADESSGSRVDEEGHDRVALSTELIAAHLRVVAKAGDINRVKYLSQGPSIVNSPNIKGETALHLAVRAGHLGVCAALIQRGADVDLSDEEGCTPLHIACKEDNAFIARVLLKNGSDPMIMDENGWTPVEYAGPKAKAAMPSDLPELPAPKEVPALPAPKEDRDDDPSGSALDVS